MGNKSKNQEGSGQSQNYTNYPELQRDLQEFAEAWANLQIADDVMDVVGDYLGDIYEYDYDEDEYAFLASGWEKRVEDYVYKTLGYPEYNDMRRHVREIVQRISENTGLYELAENDDGWYYPLQKFAEENGVAINRPPTPITKQDLDRHF